MVFLLKKLSLGFYLIIFISFLVSLLLLAGEIDPDYFTFYYIGRGVASGFDMYRDFADNKGPVIYLVFASLYLLFGENYQTALVFGSTILDGLAVYFFLSFLEARFKFSLLKEINLKKFTLLVLIVVYYKSFSFGLLGGGVYSENVAMLFLALSLYVYALKRNFWSGVLFVLGVLSRLSVLFYIIVFMYFAIIRRNFSEFLKFSIGGILALIVFLAFYILNGNFSFMYDNLVTYNLGYAGSTLFGRFADLASMLIGDPRVNVTFGILGVFALYLLLLRKSGLALSFFFVLLASGFISILGSGSVFGHHLVQITFPLIFLLTIIVNTRGFEVLKSTPIILALVLAFHYFVILLVSKDMPDELYADVRASVSDYDFMVVVPHRPRIYFTSNKASPDRYFQYYFLSKYYDSDNEEDVKRHSSMDVKRLERTAFVFLYYDSSTRSRPVEEYKSNFEDVFGLEKISEKDYDRGYRVEIYESRL